MNTIKLIAAIIILAPILIPVCILYFAISAPLTIFEWAATTIEKHL